MNHVVCMYIYIYVCICVVCGYYTGFDKVTARDVLVRGVRFWALSRHLHLRFRGGGFWVEKGVGPYTRGKNSLRASWSRAFWAQRP